MHRRSPSVVGQEGDRDDLEFGFAATDMKNAEALFTNEQDFDCRQGTDAVVCERGTAKNLRPTYRKTANQNERWRT